jgi:hypothetical protein
MIMAQLIEVYFKLSQLQAMIDAAEGKGLSITLSVDNVANKYGQNVSAYKSQTKEQRQEKVSRIYFGNGKVIWHDGQVPFKPERVEQSASTAPAPSASEDLPF